MKSRVDIADRVRSGVLDAVGKVVFIEVALGVEGAGVGC